jgi:hypothetical protein
MGKWGMLGVDALEQTWMFASQEGAMATALHIPTRVFRNPLKGTKYTAEYFTDLASYPKYPPKTDIVHQFSMNIDEARGPWYASYKLGGDGKLYKWAYRFGASREIPGHFEWAIKVAEKTIDHANFVLTGWQILK